MYVHIHTSYILLYKLRKHHLYSLFLEGLQCLFCFIKISKYYIDIAEFHIIIQSYKEWILKTIEDTWNLFHQKFTALWDEHKNGSGEAYLPAIYNNPELQKLIQEKYMKELFHDTLGFGAAKMIR